MPKNELTISGQKRELVDIQDIVKDTGKRAKLQNFIDEAVNAKIKTLDLREQIKACRDAAVEDLGVTPKIFNLLVDVYFNNNFEEKKTEFEGKLTAIEVMQLAQQPAVTNEPDEE